MGLACRRAACPAERFVEPSCEPRHFCCHPAGSWSDCGDDCRNADTWIKYQYRTLGTDHLLSHQRILLLNFAERLLGGNRSVMVSVVNPDGVSRINAEKNDTTDLYKRFPFIPPILFLLASNVAIGVGWWKLRTGKCWRDFCFGMIGLLIGFPASVWGWVVFGDRIF